MSGDTWAERLCRAVKNFRPWPHWLPLPIRPALQLDPVMDDDDTTAWGDILYVRGLLDDIVAESVRTRAHIDLEDRARAATLLDVALNLVRHDFDFPMPTAAEACEGEAAA